jgi:hypothetical protein
MYKSPKQHQIAKKVLIVDTFVLTVCTVLKYVLFRQGHAECLQCTMEQCLDRCWMFTLHCKCIMEQCLGQCWMLTLHCKGMMEQCIGLCWMFTLYDGIMPLSALNAYIVRWKSASVSAECLHCTMEQCLGQRWMLHCTMERASVSDECLHCMMEQCLGQRWIFTLYDGTVPRSVMNVYIVWWNSTSVSSECLLYIVRCNKANWSISLTSNCRIMYAGEMIAADPWHWQLWTIRNETITKFIKWQILYLNCGIKQLTFSSAISAE